MFFEEMQTHSAEFATTRIPMRPSGRFLHKSPQAVTRIKSGFSKYELVLHIVHQRHNRARLNSTQLQLYAELL
jgi:hypothetical protein